MAINSKNNINVYIDLFLGTGTADDTAAKELSVLADETSDRTRSGGHKHAFSLSWLAYFIKPSICCQSTKPCNTTNTYIIICLSLTFTPTFLVNYICQHLLRLKD